MKSSHALALAAASLALFPLPAHAAPWGKALESGKPPEGKRGAAEVAIDAREIVTLPGFTAERLYVVPKEEQGSWVALTPDPKGRILACDQYGGLYRITAPAIGTKGETAVEKLKTEISGAHGLLHAFDSLYFMKNEGAGAHGLYRLRDTNGDDQFDDVKLLREFAGGGEHGPHSIVLSPDAKSLFSQQMWYAFCHREATTGWTPELRQKFFAWFPRTWQWQGGNSFRGFLANIRTEALEKVGDPAERTALASLSAPVGAVLVRKTKPAKGPGRAWTTGEVVELTKDGLHGRNFENGKAMYATTMCATCHRFAGDGGSIGPDLTGSGARYTMRDFMENIVTPGKVISDQYESHEITMKDGSTVIGRVIVEENGKVFVATNPFAPQDTMTLDEKAIASRKAFGTSMMPPGLVNVLNQNELLDLIAYVMSGGNPQDKAFK